MIYLAITYFSFTLLNFRSAMAFLKSDCLPDKPDIEEDVQEPVEEEEESKVRVNNMARNKVRKTTLSRSLSGFTSKRSTITRTNSQKQVTIGFAPDIIHIDKDGV